MRGLLAALLFFAVVIAAFASNNTITVTFSEGGSLTVNGNPVTAYKFPLVMRVAFRGDSNFDGNEDTWVERINSYRSSSNGVLREDSSQVSREGKTHYRVEYRDFEGK